MILMENNLTKAQRDLRTHTDKTHSLLIMAIVIISLFSICSWMYLAWKALTMKVGL